MVCHHSDIIVSGDFMVSVVEGQDSTCVHSNLPLLFLSNAHDIKTHWITY